MLTDYERARKLGVVRIKRCIHFLESMIEDKEPKRFIEDHYNLLEAQFDFGVEANIIVDEDYDLLYEKMDKLLDIILELDA